MKRRRQQLQVSTFPFLAVLLCAMGALILVLLAMDRKSKMAAQQKAQAKAHEQHSTHSRALAARHAEHATKVRAVREGWEKKTHAVRTRAEAEQAALDAELREVQQRLSDVALRLSEEHTAAVELRKRLKTEEAALAKQEEALAIARREAGNLAAQLLTTDAAKAKLAADLVLLERELEGVRKTRLEDKQTYSVIPYHGQRGESRRPLYIECAQSDFVFHPDAQKMSATTDRPIVRSELERRLKDEEKPFVMLLLRPDGISTYYRMQAALKDLSWDFGTEFVDADWRFDFPAEEPVVARKIERAINASPQVKAVSRNGGVSADPPASVDPPAGLERPRPYGSVPIPQKEFAPAGTQMGMNPGGIPLAPPSPLPFHGANAQNASSPRAEARNHPVGAPTQNPPGNAGHRVERPSETKRPSGSAFGSKAEEKRVVKPAAVGGSGTFVLHVECRNNCAILHPTGQRVELAMLRQPVQTNPLLRAVEQLIANRLSRVPRGQPLPRVEILYLVHGDGVETCHDAYQPLYSLRGVRHQRLELRPGDDVSSIVGGY